MAVFLMAVMDGMKLARFRRVTMRVRAMAGCCVRMVRGDLVIVFFVILRGIAMMFRGFLVMIGSVMMVLAGRMLVGHTCLLL